MESYGRMSRADSSRGFSMLGVPCLLFRHQHAQAQYVECDSLSMLRLILSVWQTLAPKKPLQRLCRISKKFRILATHYYAHEVKSRQPKSEHWTLYRFIKSGELNKMDAKLQQYRVRTCFWNLVCKCPCGQDVYHIYTAVIRRDKRGWSQRLHHMHVVTVLCRILSCDTWR